MIVKLRTGKLIHKVYRVIPAEFKEGVVYLVMKPLRENDYKHIEHEVRLTDIEGIYED